MQRRRFFFWIGFGLFGLSERLRASTFDDLAARLMRSTESSAKENTLDEALRGAPEHWTAMSNRTWRWFEREHLIDGRWKATGITTPIHKATGQRYTGKTGYLDDSLIPEDLRTVSKVGYEEPIDDSSADEAPGTASAKRRARHGRPPSRWLRSLNADELHIWLKTIDPPEAGVSGMTFFTHLTEHHSFDATKIAGLSEDDQAKLHAAAHEGY